MGGSISVGISSLTLTTDTSNCTCQYSAAAATANKCIQLGPADNTNASCLRPKACGIDICTSSTLTKTALRYNMCSNAAGMAKTTRSVAATQTHCIFAVAVTATVGTSLITCIGQTKLSNGALVVSDPVVRGASKATTSFREKTESLAVGATIASLVNLVSTVGATGNDTPFITDTSTNGMLLSRANAGGKLTLVASNKSSIVKSDPVDATNATTADKAAKRPTRVALGCSNNRPTSNLTLNANLSAVKPHKLHCHVATFDTSIVAIRHLASDKSASTN